MEPLYKNRCGCISCHDKNKKGKSLPEILVGFRYSCELCGNKRCPHHSNHKLDCTSSNEPGQLGSLWEKE